MYFSRKKRYINQKKKELNKNNPYRLKWKDNILRILEKNVVNKFATIVIVSIVSLICARIAINYTLLYSPIPYFSSEVLGSLNSVSFYTEIMRDFYTTIISILATILSISIAVLLLYLQIVSDKYSIEFTSYTFTKWEGIRVISVFLVTIIYSLYKLLTIKQNITSCDFSDLIVAFLLTILCFILLFSYMYNTLKSLLPQNFIKEQCNIIEKTARLALDIHQTRSINDEYLKMELSKIENVKYEIYIPDILSNFVSNLKNPIRTQKAGVIENIDLEKLQKCSELMKNKSPDYKLIIFLYRSWEIKNLNSIIGYIECDDEETANKVKVLVSEAYTISKSRDYLYNFSSFSPITSVITKMIKNYEVNLTSVALERVKESTLKYIEYTKNFGLIEEPSDVYSIILPNFINRYYIFLEQVGKIALNESDTRTMITILNCNFEIGATLIRVGDVGKFNRVMSFFIHVEKHSDKYTDIIFEKLSYLEEIIYSNIKEENENINHTKQYQFLWRIVEYYGENTKTIINRNPNYSTKYFDKMSNLKRRIRINIIEEKSRNNLIQLVDKQMQVYNSYYEISK